MKKLLKKFIVTSAIVGLVISSLSVSAAGLRDVFDAKHYADTYKDLKAAFGNDEEALYQHYINFGLKENRQMSPVLDVQAYRAAYPDLNTAFGDNWDAYVDHFFMFGAKENRTGGVLFNPVKYAEAYPDVAAACGGDLRAVTNHYLTVGIKEGRTAGVTAKVDPTPSSGSSSGSSATGNPAPAGRTMKLKSGKTLYAQVTTNDPYILLTDKNLSTYIALGNDYATPRDGYTFYSVPGIIDITTNNITTYVKHVPAALDFKGEAYAWKPVTLSPTNVNTYFVAKYDEGVLSVAESEDYTIGDSSRTSSSITATDYVELNRDSISLEYNDSNVTLSVSGDDTPINLDEYFEVSSNDTIQFKDGKDSDELVASNATDTAADLTDAAKIAVFVTATATVQLKEGASDTIYVRTTVDESNMDQYVEIKGSHAALKSTAPDRLLYDDNGELIDYTKDNAFDSTFSVKAAHLTTTGVTTIYKDAGTDQMQAADYANYFDYDVATGKITLKPTKSAHVGTTSGTEAPKATLIATYIDIIQ